MHLRGAEAGSPRPPFVVLADHAEVDAGEAGPPLEAVALPDDLQHQPQFEAGVPAIAITRNLPISLRRLLRPAMLRQHRTIPLLPAPNLRGAVRARCLHLW